MDDCGHSFTWKIQNFLRNACSEREYLESPPFKIKIWGSNTFWFLRIYPSKICQTIGCYLKSCDNTDLEEVQVYFTLLWDTADEYALAKNTKYNCNLSKQKFLRDPNENWLYFNIVTLQNSSLYFPDGNFTVRFILWRFSEETPLYKYIAITHIEICKITFRPIVPNFDPLISRYTVYKSPIPNPELCITFYVKENSEYLSLKIQHGDTVFRRVRLNCQLSLLDDDGIPVLVEEDDFLFERKNFAVWNFPDFILMRDVSVNLSNLHFEFIVDTGNVRSHIYEKEYLPSSVSPAATDCDEKKRVERLDLVSIIREFQDRYMEGKLPDIVLSFPKKTFSVHRAVLCSNSSVFATHFMYKMTGYEEDSILMDDMDSDTLEMLLRFMYTELVEDLNEVMAIKLFSVAAKYKVHPLKQKCANYLMTNITVQNACFLLPLADRHDDESLKRSVQEFICNNHLNIASFDWWNLRRHHISLASEIIHQVLSMDANI